MRTSHNSSTTGYSFLESTSAYTFIFYYLLYSFSFIRSNKNVTNLPVMLSRIVLFHGNSSLFYKNRIVRSSSPVLLQSFLDRVSALYAEPVITNKYEINNDVSEDYIKILPFFHHNSIVFIRATTAYERVNNVHIACFLCSWHVVSALFSTASMRKAIFY
jgi:hypothetical protein